MEHADTKSLKEQAEEEPPKKPVIDRETIEILRKKGFSWRAISLWLQARDIKVSHVKLYRHFKDKELPHD
jgi:hypothetical protein